jgi:hypothetical protein
MEGVSAQLCSLLACVITIALLQTSPQRPPQRLETSRQDNSPV